MWYAGKFDEASWHLLSRLGLTRTVMNEQNRVMAAVQQNVTYKRELHAGDIITIRSGILEIKEKVIRFFHEMKNDETGETSAIAELTGVHMDATVRKSRPFPDGILQRGRELLIKSDQWEASETQSTWSDSARCFFPGESAYDLTR
jgi:acyl-CoA thioester hydrolase